MITPEEYWALEWGVLFIKYKMQNSKAYVKHAVKYAPLLLEDKRPEIETALEVLRVKHGLSRDY